MKPVHGSRAGELTFKVCGLLAFASLVTLAQAQDASVEALKEGIEGVYVLQEWHRNAEVMRPPLVDARIVLLNGRIVFISHDGSQEPGKTFAGYGVYVLEAGKFSYRYERSSIVTQTANGASVSEKLPWDGLRAYAVDIDGGRIHFRATNGPQEWWFNADGLSYSDGTQMRVYRRVTDK
jgi:hypothetical protein